MLRSEEQKLERLGLKVNACNDMPNGWRYFLENNMSNRYFTARAVRYNKETGYAIEGTGKTLCTRALFGTAFDRIKKHIAENS